MHWGIKLTPDNMVMEVSGGHARMVKKGRIKLPDPNGCNSRAPCLNFTRFIGFRRCPGNKMLAFDWSRMKGDETKRDKPRV